MMRPMDRYVWKKADIPEERSVLPFEVGDTLLREEREKRDLSREQLAAGVAISVPWLRDIEAGRAWPGPDARKRIRAFLEQCPIHARFKIACAHKLPVPPDEKLYAKR